MPEFDTVGFLKRRAKIVVATVLVCMLLATLAAFMQRSTMAKQPQTAAASFTLGLAEPPNDKTASPADLLQQLCATSARLGATSLVLGPLTEHMNANFPDHPQPFTESELGDSVRVSCINSTTVVEASATLDTPEQAQAAALKARDLVRDQVTKLSTYPKTTVTGESGAGMRTPEPDGFLATLARLVTLSALGGLLLGALLALGVEALRKRVRAPHDVRRLAGLEVWGEASDSTDAELWRRARAHLSQKKGTRVLVTSTKDAKTAERAANDLQQALAHGHRTSVLVRVGTATDAPAEVAQWREGLKSGEYGDIVTVTSGTSMADLFAAASAPQALAELQSAYDVVLLEAPPALDSAAVDQLTPLTDQTLLVVEKDVVAPQDFLRTVNQLRAAGRQPDGVVLV